MSSLTAPDREYAALVEGCGLLDRSERGKLALTGADAASFLQGQVTNDVEGLADRLATNFASGRKVTVRARRPGGEELTFPAYVRIDTPQEVRYYQHGGILPYVLRQLMAQK